MMANKKKGNQKQSSAFTFWIIGLIAVIIIGFIFLANGKKDEDTAVNEINYKSQPYLGEKSAPVQIVEFGDYKCPVCKTFEKQFFPSIQRELIDTGKAQFYFMNYSFINVDSTRSAKFAESVYQELGNETFWKRTAGRHTAHAGICGAYPRQPRAQRPGQEPPDDRPHGHHARPAEA
jgi:protein-disulfide isomerase